jgi:hypothetical protein
MKGFEMSDGCLEFTDTLDRLWFASVIYPLVAVHVGFWME